MDLRNPVNSLTFAMLHALEVGLIGIPSSVATDLLGPTADMGPRRRRPHARECQVTMFGQTMRASEIGFEQASGDANIDGDLVIVLGPEGDACVYFAAQFAYHVRHPNRAFFLDVAAQSMAGVQKCGAYDGRDSGEAESVEYCVEVQFARLRAALVREPAHAAAAARLLRTLADEFDRVTSEYVNADLLEG